MPAIKYAAKGVVVKSGAAATPTTVLASVKSVMISVGDVSLVDVTTHDSTTTKDFVHPKLRDTLSADLTLVWDPAEATHEAIRAAHAAGTLWYLTFILPDAGAATYEASGYLIGFSIPALTPEGDLEVTLKFKAKSVETYTQ
jgi:hypothetical protein